ncbi:MAG: PrsW family intramembrane metalloprotease [Caldilineae bacterium]|nr:MAG: PrsW family intramembrane metalloprotease [Caldilineae bacterium]
MQQVRSAVSAFYHPDPEHVAYNRRGFWVAAIVELIGLLIFVGLFNLAFDRVGAGLDGLPLIILGLLMSVVPAALWLLFFYRMDRLEPEPKEKLFGVFLLGALVAAALTEPILEGFFAIDEWLYTSLATQLVGGILLVGFLQEGTVYLVVRYGIYGNPEFDERVDGVIYAVCAGLGLATVLNFNYVLEHGGVDLGIGSVRMVVTALAHASFAGVLGYFLGQARFEKTPPLYLPAGLALAAVLNGVFFLLEERVTDAGLTVNPWNGLLLATVVAVVTLAAVFWLVERANEETLRVAAQQRRQQMAPERASVATSAPPREAAETAPGEAETATALEAAAEEPPEESSSSQGEDTAETPADQDPEQKGGA